MRVETNVTGSRFLENLAYLVPCYVGYRLPGQRREEDSRFRTLLLQRLRAIRETIDLLMAPPEDESEPSPNEWLENRGLKLDRIGNAVRHAPYGFSGFFDAEEITEDKLDRILEVDLLLFEDLDAIHLLLTPGGEPSTASPAREEFAQSLDEAICRFEHRLILRDKLLGNA